ncbi:MAG: hypothetical protein HY067_22015 [Betaproteobacteria bacterium]|nr:hypothetical protein [Betaproteobacteria bacterium]
MDVVIKALIDAARSLVHPIILIILLVPMLIALAVWIGVSWAYWGTWTTVIQNAVLDHASFTWSDHADAAEMRRIFEIARGRLFLLGLITGVMYFIPPFNLVAPVFSALAFIHLCLDELQRLRSAGAQGLGEMQGLGARNKKRRMAPPVTWANP